MVQDMWAAGPPDTVLFTRAPTQLQDLHRGFKSKRTSY